ncbi:cytochrome c oxidase assembly protein [Streptomyces griseorubiginosus]|uniref:cytochrome c oxidase assembly protein n=1 Tax=Streptomyces griseorubiginosus TaxID=67304 RepID=UPI002E81F0B5|nr:cytochrome c oxidase assembly protein [Streptomyces griseorubiginosus]WUB42070.1 cytochrome c oxidase assembly protein [Streptomyces griseorubiginosus]WUB50589.1 cytochrome c oxidase assembly protein [Streptomyces griseorubiginosus]
MTSDPSTTALSAGQLAELTAGRLLSSWQLDIPALLLIAVLATLYGWGVRRIHRRGERWSPARTAAFALLGLGALTVATMSGLAVYDHVLFWPAAVQNILLDLVAPLGLALGDPLRLAVEALPEGAAARVRRTMTGRLVRVLTFPLVSTVLVLATELTVYFTPYFATALRVGWLHQLMYLHLLVAGCLFVVPVLTREQTLPAWCTHPVRAALVFLDGIVDAVPGLVVMTHGTLIAGAWYLHHAPPWSPDVQHDQQIGGGAMLGIAELTALPFLLALLFQWARAERLQTAALDRRLDAELPPSTPPTPGQTASPERVRPWWETEQNEVAARIRRHHGGD